MPEANTEETGLQKQADKSSAIEGVFNIFKQVQAFIQDNSGPAVAIITIIAALIGFVKWSDLSIRALAFNIPVSEVPTDSTVYDVVLGIGFAILTLLSNVYLYQVIQNLRRTEKGNRHVSLLVVPLAMFFVLFLLLTFALPLFMDDFSLYWDNLLNLFPMMLSLFFLVCVLLFLPGAFMGLMIKIDPDLNPVKFIKWTKKNPRAIQGFVWGAFFLIIISILAQGLTTMNEIEGTVTLNGKEYAIIFSSNSSYCIEELKSSESGERIADRVDRSNFQWISKEQIVVNLAN